VVLERGDGSRLAITGFFADHHVIALRVLEELARRLPGRETEQPRPAPVTSDAIRPAQRDIVEPSS
jgi:hypothetical protein